MFSLDSLFCYCAYIGTAFYILRLLIGFGGEIDSGDSLSHQESDDAFRFLSLNTLIGFCMMFGWGGLAGFRQFQLSGILSFVTAVISGAVFLGLLKIIFSGAKKLVGRGSVQDLDKVAGVTGKVYQSIGTNKRGVVQIVLDDFIREFDAVSADNREIPSFETVEILKAIDQKTVLVKRIR